MFEHDDSAPETAQTDLQLNQADEATGRPSEGAPGAQDDGLKEEKTSTDDYAALKLPQELQEHGQTLAAFKELAAALKLPAQTAQKLVEWEAAQASDGRKTAERQRAEILDRWTQQTKEMFGPSYERDVARALDAADRFGGRALRELLEATGLGSHPVVVRTFHEISKQISEDVSVGGSVRNSSDKTFAEALYGKAQ